MRKNKQIQITAMVSFTIILTGSIWGASTDYKREATVLSQQILEAANNLRQETDKPNIDSEEIDFLLEDIKDMLKDYENILVFAESPYPGEILLGKTPHCNDAWAETECTSRFDGMVKEIRIRRTGSSAGYLRINDIELTSMTPKGVEKITLNQAARFRLYRNDVFKLALPKPMRITKIRIAIEHESNGLIISGIPYNFEPPRPRPDRSRRSGQVLLGTTPPGDNSWVETVCDGTARPVKQIQLKRTGRKAGYLRINDIEITYRTPTGTKKQVFNKDARTKLYFYEMFSLVLPQPMRVTHIRIRIEHESTGLQVYGVF